MQKDLATNGENLKESQTKASPQLLYCNKNTQDKKKLLL
jgi:hypothetical protein